MPKHLVLAGAGHAHLSVLRNVRRFTRSHHRVTIVSPQPYHYYSGMGPGMLAGTYRPEEIRFDVRKMTEDRGGIFVQSKVLQINARQRRLHLATGDTLPYDVVSFNTGSFVPTPWAFGPNQGVYPVKPIENLLNARRQILAEMSQKELKIVIGGGGPAGVEIAANARALIRRQSGQAQIVLVAGRRLLERCSEGIRRRAIRSLTRRQVRLIEGPQIATVNPNLIRLTDQSTLEADIIFLALGIRPSPIFKTSGIPTDSEGGLLVNRYLQSIAHPEIFGGGDCIGFDPRPLAKVGVYAVRENAILLHNLTCALEGRPLRPFRPQRRFLLIFNMGDGTGIGCWNAFAWSGRSAFLLKDYIDRKFMRSFQD